jgi:ABC-type uncharacterized transport system substrate-binding protein
MMQGTKTCRIIFFVVFGLFYSALNASEITRKVAVFYPSEKAVFPIIKDAFKRTIEEKYPYSVINEYSLEGKQPEVVVGNILKENPELVFAIGKETTKLIIGKRIGLPIISTLLADYTDPMLEDCCVVSISIPAAVRLQLIHKIIPKIQLLGILYSAVTKDQYVDIVHNGAGMGMKIDGKEISSDNDFIPGLSSLRDIDCFVMLLDPKIYSGQSIKYMLIECRNRKLPIIGISAFYTKSGALLSIECDYEDLGRQAGEAANEFFQSGKFPFGKILMPHKTKTSLNRAVVLEYKIPIDSTAIKEIDEVMGK